MNFSCAAAIAFERVVQTKIEPCIGIFEARIVDCASARQFREMLQRQDYEQKQEQIHGSLAYAFEPKTCLQLATR